MTNDNNYSKLVQNHMNVFNEIERRDVVFRMKFDFDKRSSILPQIAGIDEFHNKEIKIWQKLDNNDISDSDAIERITDFMEEYYDKKYPLR